MKNILRATAHRCVARKTGIPSLVPCALVGRSFPRIPARQFSEGSHDDFAPQRKTVPDDGVQEMIAQHIKDNLIMLYMKGTPSMPMCGFSAKVVQTLQSEGVDFSSVNVLDYPTLREGIIHFSEWPTIPQLYVNGEFIGGCDIVLGMHESGELKEVLDEVKK